GDIGDLSAILRGPGNCGSVTLTNYIGGDANNYTNTRFEMPGSAPNVSTGTAPYTGLWSPQTGTAANFNGCPVDGTWTLAMVDDGYDFFGATSGTLQNWSM